MLLTFETKKRYFLIRSITFTTRFVQKTLLYASLLFSSVGTNRIAAPTQSFQQPIIVSKNTNFFIYTSIFIRNLVASNMLWMACDLGFLSIRYPRLLAKSPKLLNRISFTDGFEMKISPLVSFRAFILYRCTKNL